MQATYSYDPYGVTTTVGANPALANANPYPYQYASGYYDTATGLYTYGQRYHQPTLARWSQQGTLNVVGDPATGNRYAYAGDDPINNIDPSGQSYLGTVTKTAFGTLGATLAVGAFCGATAGVGCATLAGAAGGAIGGGLGGAIAAKNDEDARSEFLDGAAGGAVGGALGGIPLLKLIAAYR